MRPVPTARAPRAARLATSLVFGVNAFAMANVIPRLPAIKDRLEIGDAALGAAVAGAGLGALVASTGAGFAVHRWGTARTSVGFGLALCAVSVLPGIAPVWGLLLLAYVLMGVTDAIMDVAMNAQGLVVQKAYGRSVLNGFHGWWSVGAAVGALTGAGAAAADVPLPVHLLAANALNAGVLLVASRWLLADPPGASGADADGAPALTRLHGVVRPMLPLVAFAFCATFVEDAPATWGALYVRDDVGTSAGVAGLAFVAFSTGMTVGRLSADRVIDRFGRVRVVRAGGLAAALGMAAVLFTGHLAVVLPAFAVMGVGVAPQFPSMFSAASEQPGVPAAHGLAVASWAARTGFLLAPPLVGAVSDAVGLGRALWLVVVVALVLTALSGTVRPVAGASAPA
jgi:fucose permease